MYRTRWISVSLLLQVASYVFLWINGQESYNFIDNTKDGLEFLECPDVSTAKCFKTNAREEITIGIFSSNDRGRGSCCNSEYRTYDGSQNNLMNPLWGASLTKFSRIAPSRYSDGFNAVPISVTGNPLPNVRRLTAYFFPQKNKINENLTLAMVQWGQLVAHDLARNIPDSLPEGSPGGNQIKCCTGNGTDILSGNLHHACLPIIVPLEDYWFTKHKQRCVNFVRSKIRDQKDNSTTWKNAPQLNEVSSYLDGSSIYGTSRENHEPLRVFSLGLMIMKNRQGRDMLPPCANNSKDWIPLGKNDSCYLAGDNRLNQNPQLVILHTLLTREHNRIAKTLSALNPTWSDEIIFQETRRIIIAEFQHITYNEWLPLIIGQTYSQTYDVQNNYKGYDNQIDPSIFVGFTSGAFRLLHSIIDGNITMYNSDRKPTNKIRLSDYYFKPGMLELNDNFKELLLGLVTQPIQRVDRYFDEELTQYLFRGSKEFGLDLEAIDILRGRDHGISGYNVYRQSCNLTRARNFDDLAGEISAKHIQKLRDIYEHVDDIDLIVGISLENHNSEGLVGPTARCLIAEQFYRTRVGDRFFYQHLNECTSFTKVQLNEIEKITLARIFCNVGGISKIQPNVFKTISTENPLKNCEKIPDIDLTHWKKC